MNRPSITGIEDLYPGRVLDFGRLDDLHPFEDDIAPLVDPTYDRDTWLGRVPLKGLLTPDGFHGRVDDISLTVMAEPYERLLNARQRGKRINPGRYERTTKASQAQIGQFLGFTFKAAAYTGRQSKVSPLEAEIWYAPISASNGGSRGGAMVYGMALRRIVTKLDYDREAIRNLRKNDSVVSVGTASRISAYNTIPRRRTLEDDF
ncbi:MAG TPA: hypothetical protein VLG37_04440 [Candidatus Saccharimonadales bacterium]|nr:hypothetical protein [Candidatus Saccharimonadales bacterium]